MGRSGKDQNRIQEIIYRVEKGKKAWERNKKDMVREATEKNWRETCPRNQDRREFWSKK